jgi:hypothetical protein
MRLLLNLAKHTKYLITDICAERFTVDICAERFTVDICAERFTVDICAERFTVDNARCYKFSLPQLVPYRENSLYLFIKRFA